MTVEGVTAVTPTGETLRVREVWEDNLEHEMKIVRDCIEKYPFVAMDTEFPGVVARPVGNFKNSSEYHYQTLRVNVDMLKLIQLGLTLSDKDGNLPRHNDEICVWQFNFREFDVANDIHSGEPPRVRRGGGVLLSRTAGRAVGLGTNTNRGFFSLPSFHSFRLERRGVDRAAEDERHRFREHGETGDRRAPLRGATYVLGGRSERQGE